MNERSGAVIAAHGGLARALARLAAFGAVVSGVSMAALPLWLAAAALVGFVVAFWVTMSNAWLALYIAAFPLQGVSLFGVEAFGFRLSHVFFLITLSLFVFSILIRERPNIARLQALDLLVLAFVVLRAVGAGDRDVAGLVLVEGLIVALLGWAVAALLSLPLGAVLCNAVGRLSSASFRSRICKRENASIHREPRRREITAPKPFMS